MKKTGKLASPSEKITSLASLGIGSGIFIWVITPMFGIQITDDLSSITKPHIFFLMVSFVASAWIAFEFILWATENPKWTFSFMCPQSKKRWEGLVFGIFGGLGSGIIHGAIPAFFIGIVMTAGFSIMHTFMHQKFIRYVKENDNSYFQDYEKFKDK